ncbi:bifunctional DNA-binding transcriptional regulator/O6-methylguanine-DNA methyltransferase Ada [Acidiphilium sp.]|uniref:bifunctional DNA-binding transcriptional regulator/O6-methylguanine-DNA methyltransferase Ada n=1 Tax=Acidiphilium sp. TaxID=527 RepID=UPI003D0580ED
MVLPDNELSEAAQWAAIVARDPAADGRFVYAVASTGVYCRPSCPSRQARRVNVSFHADGDAAERAGFRPCRRCRPDLASNGDAYERMSLACRRIEAALVNGETPPTLAVLAAVAKVSPGHFQRRFKCIIGVTPKQYAIAHRMNRVRTALQSNVPITTALYDAGYAAPSRFYADAATQLGMTPTTLRRGAAGEHIKYVIAPCTLGLVLVASTDRGVAAVTLGDDASALRDDLRSRFPNANVTADDAALNIRVRQVVALIEQPSMNVELPLDIRGSSFQCQVWQALRTIAPGRTETYGQIAARIGRPTASRAVAAACGANHLAVLIPCHRVVGADGNLTGYRWGVKRKRALLDLEKKTDPTPIETS